MPCGFGLSLNLKTGKDELDPRIAEEDVCKTREMRGKGPSHVSVLSYRWAIPVHSEVVFLHRSARLLIRCLRRFPSEQENISFFYAGFFFFFFPANVPVFLFFKC